MDHSLPQEEVERYSEDFRKVIEVTSSLCPCMLYIPGNVSQLAASCKFEYVF